MFLVFSILQSAMINGVHLSMDGKERINEKGKWFGTGDIFYQIARKLREGAKQREFLVNGATRKAIQSASEKSARIYPEVEVVSYSGFELIPYTKNTAEATALVACLQDMQINYGVRYAEAREFININEGYFLLWIESFRYKYSAYVRKSIGGACIKCMASFYGPITFIPVFLAFYGHHIVMYPLALANILVLVFLNYYLYKQ